MPSENIAAGYCQCGCGEYIGFWDHTNRPIGRVKGQPKTFLRGHYNKGQGRPPLERFWEKVDKRGPDDCWEWQGNVLRGGYGKIEVDKKTQTTHRFSYGLHHGPIPNGMCVCHSCDNPPCVNPDHLFLGTHQDNMTDKMKKGRHRAARGEDVASAKLTAREVSVIRATRGILPGYIVAETFGVSGGTISSIHSGRRWAEKPSAPVY